MNYCRLAILVGAAGLVAGCGSSGPFDLAKVKGTVKYDDGSLIPSARVELKFVSQEPPIDDKTHPRPGIAEVMVDDGSFIISTYKYGDGLIRGKHKVTAMSLDAKNIPTDHIPKKYHSPDTTPLEADSGDAPLFEFVIEKP